MTPMIDVVFLLLIFFVCAASGQERVDLLPMDLPPTGSIEAPAPPPEDFVPKDRLWIYLSINADGRTVIELNEREYDNLTLLKQVLTAIAELDRESPVILDIDGDVPAEDWIKVYDVCQASDFKTVSIATEQSAERKTAPKSP